MKLTPEEFINKYIGVPWVNRGESTKGIDCWGLVLASYREIEGIELPQISGYSNEECPTAQAVTKKDLSQFSEAQPANGAIMCIFDDNDQMIHVGRCLLGRVLHASAGLGVKWSTYSALNKIHKNMRYYKYD